MKGHAALILGLLALVHSQSLYTGPVEYLQTVTVQNTVVTSNNAGTQELTTVRPNMTINNSSTTLEEDEEGDYGDEFDNMTAISNECKTFLANLTFELSKDKQVWDSARYFCHKKGMELITVDTEQKSTCLQEFLQNEEMRDVKFLTGLQVNSDKTGIWSADKSKATYIGWADSSPAKFKCMALWRDAAYNVDCNEVNMYICEKNPNAAAVPENLQDLCKKDVKYEIVTQPANWATARFICNSKKMDLVSLETFEENLCILDKLIKAEMSLKAVFTSLSINEGEKNFTSWASKEMLSYSVWGSGQPNDYNGKEKCMALYKNAWHDINCENESPFICESVNYNVPAPCKDGESAKYTVSTTTATNDIAMKQCLIMGQQLVSIESLEENNCVKSLIINANLTNKQVWTSLNATSKVWGNGAPMTFTNWQKGEPNNPSKEFCMSIMRNGWYDMGCQMWTNYVCETPETPAPTCNMDNYKIPDNRANWRQARNSCRKLGMQLVSLETPQENICVMKAIENSGLSTVPVFTSLNIINGEKQYTKWDSGAPLSFNDWAVGQPKNMNEEKCMAMNKYYWINTNCYSENRYICEKSSSEAQTQSEKECQPGSKYSVTQTKANFWNARKICKKMGMDLASLETLEESNCVKTEIEKADLSTKAVFISLSGFGGKTFTKWINGKDMTYTEWAKGEPNNPNTEKCVVMMRDKWYDTQCQGENYFVCEGNDNNAAVMAADPCSTALSKSKYNIVKNAKIWSAARTDCTKTKGQDLASFETPLENYCFEFVLADADMLNKRVFSSLTMYKQKNFTKWINNAPLSYNDWAKGQPSSYRSCMVHYNSDWYDADCASKNFYVCEAPADQNQ
ncbi:macrophage mannose receptor 1-like [Neocloeon triangulifer]|uniref:macrophage mannose receptor 1-like n=1 Tax=Neocloeon triangulifer TaxID=2078957 RepID=UPI00286F2463|nr:macrophage mannose receptor 1-like [Neocloeon triangulifer]